MNNSIIFGTHKVPKESLLQALHAGIRTFDTATGYNNAEIINNVLEESKIKINIITKFNANDFGKNIEEVATEHYKLLSKGISITILLHSSLKTNDDNINAMIKLKNIFPSSKIGVSNFDIEKLKYLIDNKCKPDVISIEFHPFYQPLKLIKYCKDNGIEITGYRTFAKGQIFNDPCLKKISEKYNVTIMDVVLSWSLINNIIPIVSSTKKEHIDHIAKFIKVDLVSEDLDRIKFLNREIEGSTCMLKYCKHNL